MFFQIHDEIGGKNLKFLGLSILRSEYHRRWTDYYVLSKHVFRKKEADDGKVGIAFYHGKNFGDELNPFFMDVLGVDYQPFSYQEADLVCVGSILHNLTSPVPRKIDMNGDYLMHVWGSGFMFPAASDEYLSRNVKIHALRGELSKLRCEKLLGKTLPEVVLGDPGLLTSRFFPRDDVSPQWDVGIIPHFFDTGSEFLRRIQLKKYRSHLIDAGSGPEAVIYAIRNSRMILSSSLHGLILADSYNIPNQWIRLSDQVLGGNYKFDDYYSAFGMRDKKPVDLRDDEITDEDINRIVGQYEDKCQQVSEISDALLECFPFKSKASFRGCNKREESK